MKTWPTSSYSQQISANEPHDQIPISFKVSANGPAPSAVPQAHTSTMKPQKSLSFMIAPAEIVLGVAEQLNLADINSLMQTAHRFKDILSHLFYDRAAGYIRQDGKTPLIWAVENGRLPSIRKLLEKDPDPMRLIDGKAAAHHAAAEGQVKAIELLIGADVPVSMPDGDGHTPIHYAIAHNHEDVVRLLLAAGAANVAYDSEDTLEWRCALHGSVAKDNETLARVLLEGAKGAAPDQNRSAVKEEINCQLYAATCHGKCNIIRLLLEFGADAHVTEVDDPPPLHLAAAAGHTDAIQLLLAKGADIAARDMSGDAAIHYAAVGGREHVVRLLLNAGIDVNTSGWNERTALAHALVYGQHAVVQTLVNAGADVAMADGDGDRPLHFAGFAGTDQIIDLLLDHGAAIDDLGDADRTALHVAAVNGNLEVISSLCRAGVAIDALDMNGNSALHLSAFQGHIEFTKRLLDAGANVSITGYDGRTPLHNAAAGGQPAVIQLLIEAGADPSTVDKNGDHTALHYAATKGHTEAFVVLLKVFQERGIDPLGRCQGGRTALEKAAAKGHAEIVTSLIESGVDVALYHKGSSPLHAAAAAGQADIAEILLSEGADATQLDSFGRSPLDWASLHPPMLTRLLKYCHEYHPTDPGRRTLALRESITRLATSALAKGESNFYALGKCLLYMNDTLAARVAFAQEVDATDQLDLQYRSVSCDICGNKPTVAGGRFVCHTCSDVDLCSECMDQYQQEGLRVRMCQGHQFLEVRPYDQEPLGSQTYDRNEFRNHWLESLIAAYAAP
ncbi:hypothetical protein ETB97_003279 [Aspergillus alliaceus]|uniref:ZZ-type domain-containing protein n=1 Tax=Petromyces alliaceus TaxID=209559 RepID=A0A8H6A4C3_PETAA|nr:hypothetical protein ETB97_003279 [Aspergillus burnettii]